VTDQSLEINTNSSAMRSIKTTVCTDLIGRATLALLFSFGAIKKLCAIAGFLHDLSIHHQSAAQWMHLAVHFTTLAFILLIVITTLIRLRPLKTTDGFEPRVSALAGTFLAGTLGLLPPAEIPLTLSLVGLILSSIGGVLSVYVLLWLGRAFSITPQARRLVTSGPYALLRHPLYLSEEIMVLGLMLQVLSPLAITIAVIHWGFQLRRMVNEERVLRSAYPEYEVYAATRPRVIPNLAKLRQQNA
jgi:protein-S-isoprenylcysteine O-methyltransferase Ste14